MRLTARLLIGALLLLVITIVVYLVWYFNRPIPPSIAEHAIFEGVTYERVVQREPQPLIYHVVTIDLDAQGIGFFVTPPDDIENFDYVARITSQFLDEFGVQLAINADGFRPWHANGVFDFYPHVGDGTNSRGVTIVNGQKVTEGYAQPDNYATLFITNDNRVFMTEPDEDVQFAISGLTPLLKDGEIVVHNAENPEELPQHPRTAVAIDVSGNNLQLIVVDGRQPNYSHGATLADLATIILNRGGYNAINLDGGGSSTLVQMGADGQPVLLNSPIHTRIPGRERPVANHLGIFANPLP